MGFQMLKQPICTFFAFSSRNSSFNSFSKSKVVPRFPGKLMGIKVSMSQGFASATSAKGQKKKKRLDEICVERYQQYSRTFIQSWILQGKVLVDGKVVNKAGTPIPDKATVEIIAEVPKYRWT
ncbi:unnamed protein product [Cuscuta epithymum]|uniref:RNA-binding S4 domain-containing protein n=1 Tax=Cuscuta epithymum TaxID=186058 RepID=A0AAV0EB06_9ASTE|nr:unnamed protein product [Cuscuta epithymum]